MRWLLLGYGDLSEKRVASALQQAGDSELTAVWGRDEEKCRDFTDRHNIAKTFSGTDGLSAALKEEIDAVYVCTPVDTHLEYTIQALEAGRHVLCEKPMAIDVNQCERMIDLAESKALKLGVAYYRRCFPNLVRVKQLIDSGSLGQVIYVSMTFQEWYCPQKDNQQYWRVLPERAGGGVSYDVGSHRLDLLSYWFGNVNSIKTQALNLVHDYPAEDTVTFFMELTDFNNAPAVLNVSWGTEHKIDRMMISGSRMSVAAEALSGPEVKLSNKQGTKTETFEIFENVHTPLIEDFIISVESDSDTICSGREALKTNILLESIRKKNELCPETQK